MLCHVKITLKITLVSGAFLIKYCFNNNEKTIKSHHRVVSHLINYITTRCITSHSIT